MLNTKKSDKFKNVLRSYAFNGSFTNMQLMMNQGEAFF